MKPAVRVLVYEFDGGSWGVLEPLLSQGKLPNLKRLMEEGASGVLRSDAPLISPRIWTTIFTGKHSREHGVEFFASTSASVRQKRVWDILSEKGVPVGVFGSLVTWPPYPVNGFMIPGIFSLGPETYPPDYGALQAIALNERKKIHNKGGMGAMEYFKTLYRRSVRLKAMGVTQETFRAAFRYLVTEKVLLLRPRDRYWRKASLYLRITIDVFLHLYKRFQPKFATFHNHLCDVVSHKYWDCYEPGYFENVSPQDVKKYGKVIPATYLLADKMLGKILACVDPSTNVIIVSDHGSRACPNTIQPYQLNLDKLIDVLGIKDCVVPARFGVKSLLYFTDTLQKERVLKAVAAISISKTGERIFQVETKEQYIALSPVLEVWKRNIPPETVIHIDGFGSYSFSELFVQQKLSFSGMHDEEGIFIASGPGIRKGTKPQECTIFDVAPTLLALMGQPVAKDMAGRVLSEIMSDNFLRENPIRLIDTYEDGRARVESDETDVDIDKLKKRLSALGYL